MNRKIFSKRLAAIVLAAGMILGMSTTAFAYMDPAAETESTAEPQSTEEATETAQAETTDATLTGEASETPTTADGSAFSIPGNGEVQDHVTDGSSKEFLTIRTANNNTFYIVIDRASTTDNVYMLSTIDENDLQEFLTDSEKGSATGSAAVVLDEQPVTTTPVAEDTKETEVQKPASGNKGALLGILAVALCGLAGYYYFKIYKPKKEEDEVDDENLELDDGLLTVNEDEDSEDDIEIVDLDDVEDVEEEE